MKVTSNLVFAGASTYMVSFGSRPSDHLNHPFYVDVDLLSNNDDQRDTRDLDGWETPLISQHIEDADSGWDTDLSDRADSSDEEHHGGGEWGEEGVESGEETDLGEEEMHLGEVKTDVRKPPVLET